MSLTDSITDDSLVDPPIVARTWLEEIRPDTIAGLRSLADFLEANPGAPVPGIGNLYVFVARELLPGETDRDAMARIVRAYGGGEKSAEGDWFNVTRSFGGDVSVQVAGRREQVCERVVVGTETVIEEVPDPVAVAALPRTTVTREVEKVEWRCPDSILRPAS